MIGRCSGPRRTCRRAALPVTGPGRGSPSHSTSSPSLAKRASDPLAARKTQAGSQPEACRVTALCMPAWVITLGRRPGPSRQRGLGPGLGLGQRWPASVPARRRLARPGPGPANGPGRHWARSGLSFNRAVMVRSTTPDAGDPGSPEPCLGQAAVTCPIPTRISPHHGANT